MPNPVGRPRKNPPLEPGRPLNRISDDPGDEDEFEDDEFEDKAPPPPSVPSVPAPAGSHPPPREQAMSDEEAAAFSRAKTKDEQHVANVAAAIVREGNPELQKQQQERERRYRKAAVSGAPIAQAVFDAESDPKGKKDLENTIPAVALRGYVPITGPEVGKGKIAEGKRLEVSLAEFKAAEKHGLLRRDDPLPGEDD